jgi:hypothetical protein
MPSQLDGKNENICFSQQIFVLILVLDRRIYFVQKATQSLSSEERALKILLLQCLKNICKMIYYIQKKMMMMMKNTHIELKNEKEFLHSV